MLAFSSTAFDPAISWARRHERQISALSLAGGFAFDSATFGRIDHVDGLAGAAGLDASTLGGKGEVSDAPFKSAVAGFYQTNPIARASVTMAECAALASGAAKIAAE